MHEGDEDAATCTLKVTVRVRKWSKIKRAVIFHHGQVYLFLIKEYTLEQFSLFLVFSITVFTNSVSQFNTNHERVSTAKTQ